MATGPKLLAALAAALLFAFGGCGGDDDDESDTGASSPPAAETQPQETATDEQTATEEQELETETQPEPEPEPETEATPSPEAQPGGAGDEEPARSLALFTAQGGQIKPRVVRVPAFISIRVELRARDGNSYGLTFEGKTIEVSDGLGSVSTTLDGLRPGEAVVGTVIGARGRVRIEATAEPGP